MPNACLTPPLRPVGTRRNFGAATTELPTYSINSSEQRRVMVKEKALNQPVLLSF